MHDASLHSFVLEHCLRRNWKHGCFGQRGCALVQSLDCTMAPAPLLESNDNWQDSPNKQAIIDSTTLRAIR